MGKHRCERMSSASGALMNIRGHSNDIQTQSAARGGMKPQTCKCLEELHTGKGRGGVALYWAK